MLHSPTPPSLPPIGLEPLPIGSRSTQASKRFFAAVDISRCVALSQMERTAWLTSIQHLPSAAKRVSTLEGRMRVGTYDSGNGSVEELQNGLVTAYRR